MNFEHLPFTILFVPHSGPKDFTVEGALKEGRQRADCVKERFDVYGRVNPLFSVVGDRGETFVTVSRVPEDTNEQEAFIANLCAALIGTHRRMNGGDPLETFTMMNMKSYPLVRGADGIKRQTSDKSEVKDIVISTVCLKGQKRAVMIVFEEKMFLCDGGKIRFRLVVPTTESMPHVDTVIPGIFDRMVLDGKGFSQAKDEMIVELKKEASGIG